MSLGSHQRCVGKSQVHLTPKWIIDALGPFDLDPCAADPRPWDCAAVNYSLPEDGIARPWRGFVWLNPPFNRYQVARWIEKLANHGDGIALPHARTETEWFRPIWQRADLLLFLGQRVIFCQPDGSLTTTIDKKSGRRVPTNSGAPVVLCAFGPKAFRRLRQSGLEGAYVSGWSLETSERRAA